MFLVVMVRTWFDDTFFPISWCPFTLICLGGLEMFLPFLNKK